MAQALRTIGALTIAASCLAMSACTLPGGTKTPGARPTSPMATSAAAPDASPTPTFGTPTASETAVPDATPTGGVPTQPESPAPEASPTAPVASPEASASLEAPPSSAAPTPSAPPLGTTASPAPTAQSAAISVPAGGTRALSITDAANAGGWSQGAAQPAGGSHFIEALSAPVGCNNVSEVLEFRFANTNGTLTLGVAQGADSPSSAEKLTWTVTADGRQATTAEATFTAAPELTVPLTGVSSVTVQVSDPSPCTGTAHALITKAVVAG